MTSQIFQLCDCGEKDVDEFFLHLRGDKGSENLV